MVKYGAYNWVNLRDWQNCERLITIAICSMYGIFTYILVIFRANVGKYSIHGAYGIAIECVDIFFGDLTYGRFTFQLQDVHRNSSSWHRQLAQGSGPGNTRIYGGN